MDSVRIKRATREDCFLVGHRLRSDDYIEMRHIFGDEDPGWILDSQRLARPEESHSLWFDGTCVGIGGCPQTRPGIGTPWFMGTDDVTKKRFTFHYLIKKLIGHWRKEYLVLSNVAWKGSRSVRWLERLGFSIAPEVAFTTPSGGEFVRFLMLGDKNKSVHLTQHSSRLTQSAK